MSDSFYGALPYAWYWVLIIVLVIGAIIVLGMFINQWARKSPGAVPVYINLPIEPRPSPQNLKNVTLQVISQIERQALNNEISTRNALLAYSAVLREFAWRSTGTDFRKLNLSDIRKTDRKDLATAIEKLYPSVFGTNETVSVNNGAKAAREVVQRWT
ncbi:MAG: hypothetical protein WBA28_04055 [Microbacteriaceae bacterium]